MEPTENALAILTKNPVKGKVKTEIAKQIGDAMALKVYLQLLKHTRLVVEELDFCEKKLFYDEFIPSRDNWSEEHFEKYVQGEGGLGQRLERTYKFLFDEGFEKVVVISPDCPDMSGLRIKQAFTLLNTKDFVLGPLRDGGYYLFGMKQYHPGLLENTPFDNGTAFQSTLEIIDKMGASYKVLPELYDVDAADEIPDRLRQAVGLEVLEEIIDEEDMEQDNLQAEMAQLPGDEEEDSGYHDEEATPSSEEEEEEEEE